MVVIRCAKTHISINQKCFLKYHTSLLSMQWHILIEQRFFWLPKKCSQNIVIIFNISLNIVEFYWDQYLERLLLLFFKSVNNIVLPLLKKRRYIYIYIDFKSWTLTLTFHFKCWVYYQYSNETCVCRVNNSRAREDYDFFSKTSSIVYKFTSIDIPKNICDFETNGQLYSFLRPHQTDNGVWRIQLKIIKLPPQ